MKVNNLPEDFDWKLYIELNYDLSQFNKEEAESHYILYGFLEGRYYKRIDLNNKNVVLITSKIYVSEKKFSYIDKRSVYSKKERFEQTLETIFSVKINIPNSYIILFDNSQFDNDEYKILSMLVDKFINITDNSNLNFFTNDYEYKAFAEISQILVFNDVFFKYVDKKSVNHFFKISGRYTIVSSVFNYNNYDNKNNIFKKNNYVNDRDYYYTCFYKLNNDILDEYFIHLKTLIENKNLYENNVSDLEVILPKLLINKINLVEKLGINERLAVFMKVEII